jgi:hypothetical protein
VGVFPADFVYYWTNDRNHERVANLKKYVRKLIHLHMLAKAFKLKISDDDAELKRVADQLRSKHYPPSARVLNDGSENDDISRIIQGQLKNPTIIEIKPTASQQFEQEIEKNFKHAAVTDVCLSSAIGLRGLSKADDILKKFGLPRMKGVGEPGQRRARVAYVVAKENRDEYSAMIEEMFADRARPLVMARVLQMMYVY